MGTRTFSTLCLTLFVSAFSPLHAMQLRYLLKPGEEASFKTSFAAAAMVQIPLVEEAMKLQLRGEASILRKVRSVGRDGVFEIENRIGDAHLTTTAEGQEEKVSPPAEVSLLRMTSRGKILSISKATPSATAQDSDMSNALFGLDATHLFTSASGLMFPEQDVKIGDSWKEESTIKISEEKSVTVRCAARLVDLVEVMGYKCAKIHATIRTPIGMILSGEESQTSGGIQAETKGFTRSDLTLYFAYEWGLPVYCEGSITAVSEASFNMPAEAEELGVSGNDMNTAARSKMNIKTILQKGPRTRE